jgi:hypothetical protein
MKDISLSISGWISGHSIAFTLILFLLGCLVSLFSAEIKQFVRSWPRRKFGEFDRDFTKRRIALLKSIHKDSYYLNLWFIWNILDLIFWSITWNGLVILGTIAIMHKGSEISIWGTMSGLLVGKAIKMREIVNQLYSFDKSVKELEEHLAKYEPKAEATVSGK